MTDQWPARQVWDNISKISLFRYAFYPQLCILACSVPGTEIGMTTADGKRFLDSQRIEGTLEQMLQGAMDFVSRNLRREISFDSQTGSRKTDLEIPLSVIREAVLNALIHRDYSRYTRERAIHFEIFTDRIEIRSPGGLYGPLTVDQLGLVNSEPRNRRLVQTMEYLDEMENRQSGIITMRREMLEKGLPLPVFEDRHDTFVVTLLRSGPGNEQKSGSPEQDLLLFCRIPRTRKEITEHLHKKSTTQTMNKYVMPLIEEGKILLKNPGGYSARNQLFYTKPDLLAGLGYNPS